MSGLVRKRGDFGLHAADDPRIVKPRALVLKAIKVQDYPA